MRTRKIKIEGIGEAVDNCLAESCSLHVVIGPAVFHPEGKAKGMYFIIATADHAGQFRCDQICAPEEDIDELRMSFTLEMARRPPLVIHEMDDELAMARFCEVLWHGERITTMRKAIEAERIARTP